MAHFDLEPGFDKADLEVAERALIERRMTVESEYPERFEQFAYPKTSREWDAACEESAIYR